MKRCKFEEHFSYFIPSPNNNNPIAHIRHKKSRFSDILLTFRIGIEIARFF